MRDPWTNVEIDWFTEAQTHQTKLNLTIVFSTLIAIAVVLATLLIG